MWFMIVEGYHPFIPFQTTVFNQTSVIWSLAWGVVAFYTIVWCLFIDVVYGFIQLFVVIVVPFMMNYNGKRGAWKGMKWFFYAFYVGHLVFCGILRLMLHGNIGVIIGG